MDKEIILAQEHNNDGQSVFLYYDAQSGGYVGFGLSAYYADMVTNAPVSFSEEFQLPMAVYGRNDILDLRQSMTMVEHTIDKSYLFRVKQHIGHEGYERWLQQI